MGREFGTGQVESWVARMNDETLAAIRAGLDETVVADAWKQGRKLTADEAVGLALDSLGAAGAIAGSRSASGRP
jgi:hypothetical protein